MMADEGRFSGQQWPGPYQPPSPPAAPPPDRAGRRVVLGLLAAVGLLGVSAAGGLVLPAHDDGGVELAESGPAEVAEVELVPFRGPQGAYEISVPEGWVTASLEGDISDVGRETFPDDPEVAEGFQQLASTAPRSLLFMSIDPTEVTARTFGSNVNILRVPDPGGADQEELLADARQGIGQIDGEVTDDGTFMTPAGEAVRVAYELGPVDGIQYYVAVGGDVWTLTYTSDELPEEEPVADAVASTFTVGPGG